MYELDILLVAITSYMARPCVVGGPLPLLSISLTEQFMYPAKDFRPIFVDAMVPLEKARLGTCMLLKRNGAVCA